MMCELKTRTRSELIWSKCRAAAAGIARGHLDALGQHIEHFRRKKHFPELTFTWANLYWSCDQTDSCGHYKDHGAGAYNVNDLVELCIDDPDEFFRFRADGTISIRPGLSAAATTQGGRDASRI